jgi:four helix bundle protein
VLRIYGVVLELVAEVRPLIGLIERRDGDLGRQLRRALASGPLNIAEGSYSQGGNRSARYHTAAGSLREALAALEVAVALGYIGSLDDSVLGKFDHALGTLYKLTGAR